jgi:DNA-binding HxlR family transcriptional regulator
MNSSAAQVKSYPKRNKTSLIDRLRQRRLLTNELKKSTPPKHRKLLSKKLRILMIC